MSTYLTPDEVMQTLKIGKTTFYKILNEGGFKSFKVGRNRRVPESELLDYVASVAATAD